ncbi:MAG TPA: hypothetical protein ENI96_00875 [Sedimenticola thiotaurini]|uniref:Uncharacterized protein n=1 Tax=Sedimenticola thiotaurini TaxID=1543721 RepID=A0A831RL25_9GAMM|nr:hypothetical protein [Sedimenticola thiotaurini]
MQQSLARGLVFDIPIISILTICWNNSRVEGRGPRAEGRGLRAEGREPRAEGREPRAEGRGQRN